jgi:hypothetical protein
MDLFWKSWVVIVALWVGLFLFSDCDPPHKIGSQTEMLHDARGKTVKECSVDGLIFTIKFTDDTSLNSRMDKHSPKVY